MAQSSAVHDVNVPAGELSSALSAYSRATGLSVLADPALTRGQRTGGVSGAVTAAQGLERLLAGTGLRFEMRGDTAVIVAGARPSAASRTRPAADAPIATRSRAEAPPQAAPADPDVTVVQDVIVTARRMEERIIDVPIAVSAFSQQRLDDLRVETGGELLRAIPNVNFSKDNFTGYNFSIRGIGAKVLAATADPGVAVSFNNTPLLRNRLFEQEYFDVGRVEVLRGPQGTLYGRNATAGVINMLPNLPELNEFYGEMQGELGSHDSRRARGFVNIPLGDQVALRLAGAMTQRDGFDYNTVTERNVNGRDLWSTRVGLLWEPTSNFRANVLWERFREDDDRSRTGKNLCTRGEPPESIDWVHPDTGESHSSPVFSYWTTTTLTPNCQAASLYADEAYGVPNGMGFPITPAILNMIPFSGRTVANGYDGSYLFPQWVDPFAVPDNRQVADLRTVSTAYDPRFRAENDVFQLNFEWRLRDNLTLFSQTLYTEDFYSGMQDFFRSNATSQMYRKETEPTQPPPRGRPGTVLAPWEPWLGESNDEPGVVYPATIFGKNVCGPLPDCGIPTGGVFLDPQLGPTDRFMALDMSQAESRQWSQEFRLQSSFDGPFNFNLGANWLRYETEENYYIFSNAFTMMAVDGNTTAFMSGDFDQYGRLTPQGQAKVDAGTLDPNVAVYIDPNPLDQIDGEGHNYVRNITINETESWAVFGEGYLNLTDDVRLTLGLRYTDDTKTMTPVPSQLLASTRPGSAGLIGRGYPRMPDEELNWGEWTGRFAVDWRPGWSFTDDSLFYASYSRGYKGGGANPRDRDYNPNLAHYPTYPAGYDPEFVNAYEIGTKNVLGNGRLVFSANAFYYDYQDYQVAHLIDRVIHNENFDARIWGAEFETAWAPTRNFRLDATLGLLRTRIGDGEQSIDVMDRLQGNDDWIVLRPYPTSPATCVVPKQIIGRYIDNYDNITLSGGNVYRNETGFAYLKFMCLGPAENGGFKPDGLYGNLTGIHWDPLWGPNEGRGFSADLSGNELPNAPRVTFNIGAQYRIDLPQGWDVTLRGDYYRQSDSWMRVYNNAPFDRLRGWDNANISFTLTNPTADLVVQAYVKNLFDDTPITDGFVGPDEVGAVTNVFTLDPRIIGVSVRRTF